jgi:hypothetical protein
LDQTYWQALHWQVRGGDMIVVFVYVAVAGVAAQLRFRACHMGLYVLLQFISQRPPCCLKRGSRGGSGGAARA